MSTRAYLPSYTNLKVEMTGEESQPYHSTPGQKNTVGVWFPSYVPQQAVVLNYTRCLLCQQPMLRNEGFFVQICWRQGCYEMRLAKHNKTLDVLYGRTEEQQRLKAQAQVAEAQYYAQRELEHLEQQLRRRELRLAMSTRGLVKRRRVSREDGSDRRRFQEKVPGQGLFSKLRPIDQNDRAMLQMLHGGASWRWIATVFQVAYGSVYMWGHVLFQKLGCDNKHDALREALRRGLIEEAHRA